MTQSTTPRGGIHLTEEDRLRRWRQVWWGFGWDDPQEWLEQIAVTTDSEYWESSHWCRKKVLDLVTSPTNSGSRRRKGDPPCRRYDCIECGPMRAAWWLRHLESAWVSRRIWVVHIPLLDEDRHGIALTALRKRAQEYFFITRCTGETTFFASNDPRGDGTRGHRFVAHLDGAEISAEEASAVFAYSVSVPGLGPRCYYASKAWRPKHPKGDSLLLSFGREDDEAVQRLAQVMHQRTGWVLKFEYDYRNKESEPEIVGFTYPPDLHHEFRRIVRYVNALLRAEAAERKEEWVAAERQAEADPWGFGNHNGDRITTGESFDLGSDSLTVGFANYVLDDVPAAAALALDPPIPAQRSATLDLEVVADAGS